MKRFIFALLLLLAFAVPPSFSAPFVKSDIQSPTITRHVEALSDLLVVTASSSISTVSIDGFFDGSLIGGGVFVWDAVIAQALANGGTIIDPSSSGGFDGTHASLSAYLAAQGGGAGTGCWIRQYTGAANVTWFGTVGDGVADDLPAVSSTLAASSYVDGMTGDTYLLDGSLEPNSNNNFNLSGSTLKLADGQGVLTPVVRISDKSNVSLYGGTIDGNRSGQTNPGGEQDGGYHGLATFGSDGGNFHDLLIKDCSTDGVYLRGADDVTPPTNNTFKRIISDSNSRQGMSYIHGIGTIIEDCTFSNTAGLAPEAGFDIEPNQDTQLVDITFKGINKFIGNAGRGFLLDGTGSTVYSIKFDRFVLTGNAAESFRLTGTGPISMEGISIDADGEVSIGTDAEVDLSASTIRAKRFSLTNTPGVDAFYTITVNSVILKGTIATSSSGSAFYMASGDKQRIRIKNVDSENLGTDTSNSYSGVLTGGDVSIDSYISRSPRGLTISGTPNGSGRVGIDVPVAMQNNAVRVTGDEWKIVVKKAVVDGSIAVSITGDRNIIDATWNFADATVVELSDADRNKITVFMAEGAAVGVSMNSTSDDNFVTNSYLHRGDAGTLVINSGTGNIIDNNFGI